VIKGKSILAVIPARGGSKGLPKKNILELAGKALIAWSIEAASKSRYIDRLIISTDSKKIADVAKQYNCEVPFMRPPELATDDANSDEVILHALDKLGDKYDIVMVLQPTSPLRESKDIDQALELMQKNNISAVVSVCSSKKPLHWHFTLESDGKLKQIYKDKIFYTNRQELPITYSPNGALYIAKTDYFRSKKTFYTSSTFAYLMPPERSVDIDNQIDFFTAEAIIG